MTNIIPPNSDNAYLVSYKVYTVLLSHAGTSAPSVNLSLKDDFENIILTRESLGVYKVASVDFTVNKSIWPPFYVGQYMPLFSNTTPGDSYYTVEISDGYFLIKFFDAAGNSIEWSDTGALIPTFIQVYQ